MYNIHDNINDFINTNIKSESLTTQFVYNFLQARVENDTSILEYQLDDLLNKLENNNSDFANIIRLGVTKDTKYLFKLTNILNFMDTIYIWRHALNDEDKELPDIFLKMADKLATKEFYITPRDNTPLTNTNYHNNLVQKLTYILSDIQPKFSPEDIINAVKKTYKDDQVFVTYIRLLYNLAYEKPKMATVQGNNLLRILFTTNNKATKEELEIYINLIVLILNSTDTTSILYRQSIKNMFKKLQESVAYESIKLNNVTNYIDLIRIFYKYDITLINMTPGMETEDFNKVLDIYLKSKCSKIYGVLKTALDNIDYEHISKINDTKFLVDVLQNKLIYTQIPQLEQLKPLANRVSILFDTLQTNNLLLNLLVNNAPEFVETILALYANRDASPFETSYKFNDIIEILPALTPICLKNKVLTQELITTIGYELDRNLYIDSKSNKCTRIIQALCDNVADEKLLKDYYEQILSQYLKYNKDAHTTNSFPNTNAALRIIRNLSPLLKRLEGQDTLLEFCKKHNSYCDLSDYLLDDTHKRIYEQKLKEQEAYKHEKEVNEFLAHNNLDDIKSDFKYKYYTDKRCIEKIKDLLVKESISELLDHLNDLENTLSDNDIVDTLKRFIMYYENSEEKIL